MKLNKRHIFLLILASLSCIFITFGFTCFFSHQICPPLPAFNIDPTKQNIYWGIPMIIIGFTILLASLFGFYLIPYEKINAEFQALLPETIMKKKIFNLIYVSHFLSSWGDRMLQFAIPVILMLIFKTSFLPTAIYGIAICLGNIIGLQFLGKWIDNTCRWKVQKKSIILENISIVFNSILICYLPYYLSNNLLSFHDYRIILIIIFGMLFSIVAEIMNNAQTISTEKDWIIVISDSSTYPIEKANATMKRIDLFCKIVAPAFLGIILDFFSHSYHKIFVAGIVILIWNIISFPLETLYKLVIYENFSELENQYNELCFGIDSTDLDYEDLGIIRRKKSWFSSTKLYFKHFIFLASISGCLLYMTVLSNGAIMTNYLQWRNISLKIIALSRGLGALMGFLGTYLYIWLTKRSDREEKIGLISLWSFFLLLSPILFSFIIVPFTIISDYTLIISCIVSRTALWIFDLVLQSIMQRGIGERERGKINSSHTIMYQIFTLLINIFGIIFYNPENFIYLIIISLVAILSSAIVFSLWYNRYVLPSGYIYLF